MTQRDRLLTLLRGDTPDCVPFYADLSHWFAVERGERRWSPVSHSWNITRRIIGSRESRASETAFEAVVKRWLDLRLISPRLVLAPGDQVPPHAPRARIERAAEIAETHGRY